MTAATTVIIPAHGNAPHLPHQLASLDGQDSDDWDLIVADNGLSPHARAYLQSWLPRAAPGLWARTRVTNATRHAGKSYAVNKAAADGTAGKLVLLDADDTCDPAAIRHLTKALDDHPYAAGRLEPYTLNHPAYAGRRAPLQHDQLHRWRGVPVAIGAAIAIRRDTFDLVEGLNETLTHQVDLDLSLRLAAHHIRPTFVEDAVIHYRYRHGLGATWQQEVAYGRAEARLYATWRHAVPARRARETVRDWAATATAFAAVLPGGDPSARARAATRAGAAWGRARGSVENRVLYL